MLARKAAIKLIRAEAICCTTPKEISDAKKRFEREANATAALHSPHTVALYDYGVTDDGIFYYVMELLEGLDLESFIERFGPLTAPRVIYLLRQTCASLAEAHAYGLTHRDIKPKNIYMCRLGLSYDFVKVLDFGLVKTRATSNESRLTHDGATTGTPAYMAPEMALGHREVDARADLYAVGCVGYWLLTGQLVFEAANALSMALAHVQTPPVPPSQRTEVEVPADLDAVIMECLQKDPSLRPQSARELDRMLAACQDAENWDNDRAEQWWRMHLPRDAQCGHTELPAAEVVETAHSMPSVTS
jgi:serine/threonine-protein kinase